MSALTPPESPSQDADVFRWAIESTGEAVAVLDPSGRMRYASPGVRTLMGESSAPEGDVLALVHEEDRPDVRAALALAAASEGGAVSTTFRLLASDGRHVVIEAQARLASTGHLLLLLADPVQRAQADDAKAFFSSLMQCTHEAIVAVTLDGLVTCWNGGAERLFGHRADEMLGTSVIRMVPEELRAETTDRLRALLSDGRVTMYDTERLHKDGRRIPVSVSLFPIRRPDGTLLGVGGIARDNRLRVVAEESLAAQAVSRRVFRRMLQGFCARSRADRTAMRETGRELAGEVDAATMEEYVRAFNAMGLGGLVLEESAGERHVVSGRDLVELDASGTQPTCHVPLGFLEAAAGRLAGGEGLGAEVACQSLRHAKCTFVVRSRRR